MASATAYSFGDQIALAPSSVHMEVCILAESKKNDLSLYATHGTLLEF